MLASATAVGASLVLAGCSGSDTAPAGTGTDTAAPLVLGASVAEVPQANFSYDYEGDPGRLTVTHAGGSSIRRSRLYVRGSGFADRSGVDMTGPGQWAGTASGSDEGQPAVVAGDSVTVGVRPSCRVHLVWQSNEKSAVLSEYTGPEA